MRWASRGRFPAAPALCPRALAAGIGVFSGHGHEPKVTQASELAPVRVLPRARAGRVARPSPQRLHGVLAHWPLTGRGSGSVLMSWPRAKSHTRCVLRGLG
eukprot:scaffold20553_cov74-Phaeocystis_antarctica.AAC.3